MGAQEMPRTGRLPGPACLTYHGLSMERSEEKEKESVRLSELASADHKHPGEQL